MRHSAASNAAAALQASPNLQYFSKGAAAGAKMFSVINRKPAIDTECSGAEPGSVEGRLRLEGVSFAYPARPDVTVLKSLTLDVPAGGSGWGGVYRDLLCGAVLVALFVWVAVTHRRRLLVLGTSVA